MKINPIPLPAPVPNRQQFTLLLLGSIFLLLFVGVAVNVYTGSFLKKIDGFVFNFLQNFKNDFLDQLMTGISFLGNGKLLLPASLLITLIFLWKKSFWLAAHFSLLVLLNGLMVRVLKWLIHAKRPDIAQEILPISELYRSFPSGHVSLSLAVFGFSAFLIARNLNGRNRLIPYGIATILVFLIAFSRIYLGVHWLSDVIGAFFFSLSCVLLTIASYQRRLNFSHDGRLNT